MGELGKVENLEILPKPDRYIFASEFLTFKKDMDYLCYTVEESKFVRGNLDAQRMIIETMKRKLCGRSDEKDQPRRSTLGEISRVKI